MNIPLKIMEIYIYFAAFLGLAYSFDILAFVCSGCKFKQTAEEALGSDSRIWDPFRFNEHAECAICLMDFGAED